MAPSLQERVSLCPDEPFAEQPTAAGCSGTLIAPDRVLTAGHCISTDTCSDIRLVFGYAMDPTGELATIAEKDVYGCAEVVAAQADDKIDYAIVRLDRAVEGRTPARVRVGDQSVTSGQPLFAVGYPSGLPQKVAEDARVGDPRATTRDYFTADIDSFQGSSGSGVFDVSTGEVVGILVHGPDGGGIQRAGETCVRLQRVLRATWLGPSQHHRRQ